MKSNRYLTLISIVALLFSCQENTSSVISSTSSASTVSSDSSISVSIPYSKPEDKAVIQPDTTREEAQKILDDLYEKIHIDPIKADKWDKTEEPLTMDKITYPEIDNSDPYVIRRISRDYVKSYYSGNTTCSDEVYEYDLSERKESQYHISHSSGNVSGLYKYYDEQGRVTQIVHYNTECIPYKVQIYSYDDANHKEAYYLANGDGKSLKLCEREYIQKDTEGNILEDVEYITTATASDGTEIDEYEYEGYHTKIINDEQGRMIYSYVYYYTPGYPWATTDKQFTYTYDSDSDGRISKRTAYYTGLENEDDYLANTTEYTYDEKGRPLKTKCTYYKEKGTEISYCSSDTYRYDDEHHIVTNIVWDDIFDSYCKATQTTYDDHDQVISIKTSHADSEDSIGSSLYYLQYKYDGRGNMISEEWKKKESSNSYESYCYQYDENDRITSLESYLNGSLSSKETKSYDDNGRFMSYTKTNTDSDGNESTTEIICVSYSNNYDPSYDFYYDPYSDTDHSLYTLK